MMYCTKLLMHLGLATNSTLYSMECESRNFCKNYDVSASALQLTIEKLCVVNQIEL